MYNPFPYDDPKPVNRPALAGETIDSITSGTPAVAKRLAAALAESLQTDAAPRSQAVPGSDRAYSAAADKLSAQQMTQDARMDVAMHCQAQPATLIVAFDGYTTAQWVLLLC